MFYPDAGTSEIQRLQMATQAGDNVSGYAVNGNFDDAQTGVKRLFSDESLRETLVDDVELLDGASYEFDMDEVRHGKLSPVFFGSALTNFGVEPFLEDFLKMTTPPLPRGSSEGEIDPFDPGFSAFVFKIQANMNKAHRDRVAFMRICSGEFDKTQEYYHVQGERKIKLSQPQQLMAQDREIIDRAYAGDIIGVFDPGVFSIGDTICTANRQFEFAGIPTFAPEHVARIRQTDTLKRKQFVKGTTQILSLIHI